MGFFLASDKAHANIHHWSFADEINWLNLSDINLSFVLIRDAIQSFLREPVSLPDHAVRSVSKIALTLFEILGWEHELVAVSFEDLLALVLQVKKFDLVDVMGKIVNNIFVNWIPVVFLELAASDPAWSPFIGEVCVSIDRQVAEVINRVEFLNDCVDTEFSCTS